MSSRKWEDLTVAQRKGLRKGQILHMYGGVDAALSRLPEGFVYEPSMLKRLEQARALVQSVKIDCIVLTLRAEEKK